MRIQLQAYRLNTFVSPLATSRSSTVHATRAALLDRIQHLGQAYISDGEVDFDDRRRLNNMHSVYHSGLGGNGDLDVLMREVNALPLKK